MQPTVLNSQEHFHNLMAMRVFREACSQWCVENKNFRYDVTIKTIYFDMGQDWKYTAFITEDEDEESEILSSWQSLCPRDWSLVVECTDIPKIIDMAWCYMDSLVSGKDIKLYEKFE
jgi:hypothetical protein